MSTLVVGDIHGCWEELQELLAKARVGPGDRVIAIGDVCDRGPQSDRVLEFFLSSPNAASIQGNHERKHLLGINGLPQRITRQQCGPALYERALAWMRSLPYYLDLPEALLVHWGLMPGVPLDEQHPSVLTGEPVGEMSLTGMLGDSPWFNAYEGTKPVVYGHHSYASGVRRGIAYGIDTGCVYGQELTGLLLPEMRLVSVAARQNHWLKIRKAWLRQTAGEGGEADGAGKLAQADETD